MFVVGVTGGIGSGKSAATARFAELGITVIDADQAARTVVEPGKPALAAIAEHFGEEILVNGVLDRAALRRHIFTDPAEKQWLEALLHPLIRQEVEKDIRSASGPYVIFVSPLLIEAKQDALCDRLLVVDVPESVQIQRTVIRDNENEAQVRSIILSQASRDLRLEKADDIIDNTAGLSELTQQVDELHQKYLVLSTANQ